MAKRIAPLLGLAALAATPTAAQLKPSPAKDIVAATVDCWQSIGAKSVDVKGLQARGWMPGQITDKNGKAAETPLRFFGKKGSNVMLTVLDGDKTSCIVMSRVASLDSYPELVRQMTETLKSTDAGLKAARGGTNGVAYISGDRIALLEPSGTKEKPGARIMVGYRSAEKK